MNLKQKGKLKIEVDSTLNDIISFNSILEIESDETEISTPYLYGIESWVRDFNSKIEISKTNKTLQFNLYIPRIKINTVLDELAINEIRNYLKSVDNEYFANKSKEELIKAIKDRSENLRKALDYLADLEIKSKEIEELNLVLTQKNLDLEESMEAVRQADHMKSQFLANMSHELRTPLNSIIGFSQLIFDGLAGEVSDDQKDLIKDILSSANHLLELINQILDISKIEAGMMNLNKELFNSKEFFDQIKSHVNPLLEAKGLEMVMNIDDSVDLIYSDEIRLKQVMLNLVSNAIKFSYDNSVISLTIEKDRDYLEFAVTDQGIGIKEEDQGKIFEEFKQVDDSHTRAYQGTGLGLALCKRLIELHQGKIWVESAIGEGSTFYFTIPEYGGV